MRVGSTWVCRMIMDALRAPIYTYIDKDILTVDDVEKDMIVKIRQIHDHQVLKSHLIFPKYYENLVRYVPELKIVNIRRNKPDALYSRFMFAKYHRPCEIIRDTIGNDFFNAPDDVSVEMLRDEKKILQSWHDHFDQFDVDVNTSNILTLKYESLIEGNEDYFAHFLQFLNRKPSAEYMDYFISNHGFRRYQEIEKNKFPDRDRKHLFHRSAGKEDEYVEQIKLKL